MTTAATSSTGRRARFASGRTAGVLACLLCALAATSCAPDRQDTVVARVGERQITLGELMTRMREAHGPSLLVEMIDEMLMRSAAEQAGIEAGHSELDLRLQRAVAECGSQEDFERTLEGRGTSRAEFVEELRLDILLDKLALAHMNVDEQEVRDFYREHLDEFAQGERVRARMILLPAREDAQAVRETLEAGGDFAGLAQALSTDPATKDQGGDMGYFERDDYAAEISEVAFALQPGELSEVFQAPDGWVILKVEDRKPAADRPLEEVRDELLARIRRAKLPSAREAWIKQARSQAAISIGDDEMRGAALELLRVAPAPEPVSLLPLPRPPVE